MGRSFAALALCDRAYQFLCEHGAVSEDELLAHVYGGRAPAAIRDQLAVPLAEDLRIERRADGTWAVRGAAVWRKRDIAEFTALAVAASGASPGRARVVRIAAVHVRAGQVVGSFDALLNPRVRVPRYALDRIGVETEVLEDQPPFEAIYEEFVHFLEDRPVLAQEVRLAWAFIQAEARRIERVAIEPELIDLNRLANQLVPLRGKPTLGAVAAQLGISAVDLKHADEEARVLGLVGARLLAQGALATDADDGPRVLNRAATARASG